MMDYLNISALFYVPLNLAIIIMLVHLELNVSTLLKRVERMEDHFLKHLENPGPEDDEDEDEEEE